MEDIGQLGVPFQAADVEEQGAGCVAGIGGVDRTAREPPQQPTVDGAERHTWTGRDAPLGKQPGQLGGGEVRVEHQAGAGPHQLQVAGGLERLAEGGASSVLPHDGPMESLTGTAVPQHHGLALVGDPDRRHRLIQGGQQIRQGGGDGRPDLLGVVLNPPGAGKVLGKLPVAGPDRQTFRADGHGPNPCRARVEGD